MSLLLPILIFVAVFGGVFLVSRRSAGTVAQLDRHQIAGFGGMAAPMRRERRSILGVEAGGSVGKYASKVVHQKMRTKAGKQLLEAGNPIPLGTFLLVRVVCIGLTPLVVVFGLRNYGFSMMGIIFMGVGAFAIPNLPSLYIKRKIRKRTKAIEMAMPDALDLLVVAVEGGMSLDGGLQQVAKRTEGVLAAELSRLQSEIATGMSRRDAFHGLGARSQSQSLRNFCTTIVQADKMGMSIAMTLRTLTETMRTKRRQAAETQARKAPIKMLPFLVIFMIPSLFIVILGPAVIAIIDFFSNSAPGK